MGAPRRIERPRRAPAHRKDGQGKRLGDGEQGIRITDLTDRSGRLAPGRAAERKIPHLKKSFPNWGIRCGRRISAEVNRH